MTSGEQKDRAEHFRELHRGPSILVLPNAWDAASARIFEAEGFPAVATTSAGVANSLGYADGEYVPLDELLFVIRRITATVQIPVTADMEAGFGSTVEAVAETVRQVVQAGAIGINIEDSVKGGEFRLLEADEMVQRVTAIRTLAAEMGVPLFINARTDAFHHPAEAEIRFVEAVRRANEYLAVGADCAFVPFVSDRDIIARLAKDINGPLNILATAGVPPIDELEALGVARISMGSGPCRASMALTQQIARDLHRGRSLDFLQRTMPPAEANGLFLKLSDPS